MSLQKMDEPGSLSRLFQDVAALTSQIDSKGWDPVSQNTMAHGVYLLSPVIRLSMVTWAWPSFFFSVAKAGGSPDTQP